MKVLGLNNLKTVWEKAKEVFATKEEIPTKVSELENDARYSTFSGSYDDLNDKPDIQGGGNGKSAYEVAVENGYTGTETEWLASLKGEKGNDGKAGPQGEKGDTGPVGPKGEKGDKGEQGLTGPQGIIGPKGDTGDIGPEGPQGMQGLKGDKGDTGPVGPQGPAGAKGATGPKGDKGDTGATGAQGPQGVQGPQGPQGIKGATGAQGPQGVKGDTGPAGPQGEKGDAGTNETATPQKAGIVKPDNKTIRADSAGTLSTLNWATGNPSTALNKWCKIASVTLLTTRFEDFSAVILAQELEMMYGSVLIHWNCNSESGGTGADQMKTPCRLTALCGNGRTMSEYFEKCFSTECVQADETHVTYNLWYEPKLAYLRYTFSLLGANANYEKDYQIYTNPEYVTEPLKGRIVYPEKNTWPFLTANLLATVPGTALDATMGKTLNDRIDTVNSSLNGMQYYNSISQLGLGTTATLLQVCNAMAQTSTAILNTGSTALYGSPVNFCRLNITRIGTSITVQAMPYAKNLWGRMYFKTGSITELSDWFICTATAAGN